MDVPVPGAEAADADSWGALAELEAYSLVTRASEAPGFSVHRLVQEVARRRQGGGQAVPPGLSEALRWVDAAFVGETQDVRDWPVLDPLTPHARAVAARVDSHGIADPTTRLMSRAGRLLSAKALHAEAEPPMRRVLAGDEASFGAGHPNVAIRLNNLATLLHETSRLAKAEPLMRRALEITLASFGLEHSTSQTIGGNYVELLKTMGKTDEDIHLEVTAVLREV